MDPDRRVRDLAECAGWAVACRRIIALPEAAPAPGERWRAVIAVVDAIGWAQPVVYKSRRLLATEYIELTEVLDRVAAAGLAGLPRVLGHRITHAGGERRLHLLLELVDGVALTHGHSADWTNDPAFTDWLLRRSGDERAGWVGQLATTLDGLHAIGVLCPDLKTEQLIAPAAGPIVLVDVDGFALAGGYTARMARWQSAALPDVAVYTVDSDRRRLDLVGHELRYGRHALA